jgi:3-oxoacyl-[acyl-carrier-protein] synthase-3
MNQFPGSIMDIEYNLPEKIISNKFFAENYPEWDVEITQQKTGVHERRIAEDGQTAYDLALVAAKKLLNKHPGLSDKIDAVIFCTQSPDYIMPSNAFLLQRDLGLKSSVMAFDYNLACSGYIYGLLMSSGLLSVGVCKNILLVTADTYSKYIDENDRATRFLFGDGAAATWIGNKADHSMKPLISSFDSFKCASDGKGWDKFYIEAGACRNMTGKSKISMNGLHVLNFVNSKVTKQISEALAENELSPADIDLYLFHQASNLALESLARFLKFPEQKTFSNLKNIGNTVSSSLPILIKDYFDNHSLPDGSKILLCGFGVGFSWGTLIAER